MDRQLPRWAALFFFSLAAAVSSPTAWGQIKVQVNGQVVAGGEEEEGNEASFVQPEHEVLQLYSRAQKWLQEGRYSEAVHHLGKILAGNDDGALPRKEKERIRFLKAETLRMLDDMPAEGHQAYELQFGADARLLLNQALERSDLSLLEAVVRQYFHTQAGNEATHLLGLYHMDHNRPLSAALNFKRLVESPRSRDTFGPELPIRLAACLQWAGMPDLALKVLLELKERDPGATIEIDGKPVSLFSKAEDALPWLARTMGEAHKFRVAEPDVWAMVRGNASRSQASSGGRPLLNYRWRVPMADDPNVLEFIGQLRESQVEQNLAAIPAMQPLAVGGVILMRTAQNLLAVDFATGKRIWEVRIDEPVERLLDPRRSTSNANSQALLASSLTQRMWQDATFGTMSSDGDLVYTIEDLPLVSNAPPAQQRVRIMVNGRRQPDAGGRSRYNRLMAHEIKTEGKLKWSLGGSPGEEELQLAGAFFLGPPLPLAGRLYCLAEINKEIRLLAINPKRDPFLGETLVEWSLPLAGVETPVSEMPDRRFAGVSPSYADGVLVCPTGSGLIVGVDMTTRSIRWGHSHTLTAQMTGNRMMAIRMGMVSNVDNATRDGWTETSVVIVGNRVVVTPSESDRLLCLNLADGEPLWSVKKEEHRDGLYLGCVHDGKVAVIGRTSARGFHLDTGKQAWEYNYPSGGTPSGRGFLHQGKFYLPLSTAEVVALDAASGQEAVGERARSRHQHVPGNLISYQGAILSQSVESVDCFYQASEIEQQIAAALRDHPDDAEAMTLKGELLIDQGKLPEAVAILRKASSIEDDPRTRDLLVDALLEGFRRDFSAHRGATEELEKLMSRPEQWDVYLRLKAAGLHKAGERPAAFEAYMKLANIGWEGGGLAREEAGLQVRRDRWVQARLSQLTEEAAEEERTAMDARIAARLEEITAEGNRTTDNDLRTFLRFFGHHTAAQRASRLLASRLSDRDVPLEVEQLLRRAVHTTEPRDAATATHRLAEIMTRQERISEAARYYSQLRDQFADVPVSQEKTGGQIVEGLPTDAAARIELAGGSIWPQGQVNVDKKPAQAPSYRTVAIDVLAPPGEPAPNLVIEIDLQRNLLLGRDRFGRSLWQLSLQDLVQQNNFAFHNPGVCRAMVMGNLVIATLGWNVIGIDTLSHKSTARILWKQDLSAGTANANPFQFGFQQMQIMPQWGGRARMITSDASGRRLGMIGPATDQYVCFIRGRTLMALDPLTGDTLWSRMGVHPNSQLFGDQEYVFIASAADDAQATVLRAVDGVEVGRRPIANQNERMLAEGRHVLQWSNQNNKVRVQWIDVWEQKPIWTEEFANGSKASVLETEAVGVVEPTGRFTLLRLADGKALIKAPLEAEPRMHEMHLIETSDRYLLLVNTPIQGNQKIAGVQPIPGGFDCMTVNGTLYGFDRKSGQKQWSISLENQGLMLNQPPDLPVLVFASHIFRRDPNNGNNVSTSVALVCVDKRNGRIVLNENSPNAMSHYELTARPEAKAIDLRMQNQLMTLTFTDKPLPVEEKPAGEREEKKGDQEPQEKQSRNAAPADNAAPAQGIARGLIRRILPAPLPVQAVPIQVVPVQDFPAEAAPIQAVPEPAKPRN